MRRSILVIGLLVGLMIQAQEHAYKIYTAEGKEVSYKKMIKKLIPADVVFFGELHNNPIAHWLELEVTKSLNELKTVRLGAEMFETDEQVWLDQYLRGAITAKQFDSLAGGLWNNFFTDYLPLVDFAKENGLSFAATNIPRKYASQVFKKGLEFLDSLPKEEKEFIAPLPIVFDIEVACYKNMMGMMPGHSGENFPKAQAIKDATMASRILLHSDVNEENVFIHFNGSYHSDNKEGIAWYLKQVYLPDAAISNITLVTQKDINSLEKEYLGTADFIIVVDEDVTTSY